MGELRWYSGHLGFRVSVTILLRLRGGSSPWRHCSWSVWGCVAPACWAWPLSPEDSLVSVQGDIHTFPEHCLPAAECRGNSTRLWAPWEQGQGVEGVHARLVPCRGSLRSHQTLLAREAGVRGRDADAAHLSLLVPFMMLGASGGRAPPGPLQAILRRGVSCSVSAGWDTEGHFLFGQQTLFRGI